MDNIRQERPNEGLILNVNKQKNLAVSKQEL